MSDPLYPVGARVKGNLHGYRLRLEGRGHVSEIALLADPRNMGYEMLVMREYDRIGESLDLQAPAPWVMWRQLVNGDAE